MKGLFVTAEGIDGCGKSTFVKGLARALKASGRKVFQTTEPSDTWLGDAVRRSWKSGASPYTEACLFLADRVEHCKVISAHLAKGEIVISDRYHDSTLAYQGAALSNDFKGGMAEAIAWLERATPKAVLEPDLTFLLKVDPKLAMERISGRAGLTKFEKLAYLRKVDDAYCALSFAPRFVILAGNLPPAELVERAVKAVEGKLASRK